MDLIAVANTSAELQTTPIDALEQNLVEALKRKHPKAPVPALQDAVHSALQLAQARVVDLLEQQI
jgi:hypothetical protein